MLRPAFEPGHHIKYLALAVIQENVSGRALICCCADTVFGSCLIAVRRSNRRRRERWLRYLCVFAVGKQNVLGVSADVVKRFSGEYV